MRTGMFWILFFISSSICALEDLKHEKPISEDFSPSQALVQVGLEHIPKDILCIIFYYCNIKTLNNLGIISTKWKDLNPRGTFNISFHHPRKSKFNMLRRINLKFRKSKEGSNNFERISNFYKKGRFKKALNNFQHLSQEQILSQICRVRILADLLALNEFFAEAEVWYRIYYSEVRSDSVDDKSLEDIKQNIFEQTKLLLRVHAEQIDANFGSTALIWAAQKKQFEPLHLLAEYHAYIYATDNNLNLSVFDFAMKNVYLETLQVLFESGLDINTRDSKYGSTALMFAAQQSKKEAVQFLVDKGADRTLLNNNGHNVLFYATDNEEILSILNN